MDLFVVLLTEEGRGVKTVFDVRWLQSLWPNVHFEPAMVLALQMRHQFVCAVGTVLRAERNHSLRTSNLGPKPILVWFRIRIPNNLMIIARTEKRVPLGNCSRRRPYFPHMCVTAGRRGTGG